jgi:hypothetical protein
LCRCLCPPIWQVTRGGADTNARGEHGTTALLSAVCMLVHERDRLNAIPEAKRKGQVRVLTMHMTCSSCR